MPFQSTLSRKCHSKNNAPALYRKQWALLFNHERLCRRTASVVLPRRRQGRRGSFRPRQTDRASAKRMRCQGGAAHQLKVRSQGSLLVPSSQRALRAGLPVWIPENPELPEHLEPPKNLETLNSEPRTARERSERAANLQHLTANIQQRTFLF